VLRDMEVEPVIYRHAEPGDVIVFRRRSTWKAWLFSPVKSFISWRIRATTKQPWNHVAGYLGHGLLSEAEWNKGIVLTQLATYPPTDYEWMVIKAPAGVDRDAAVAFWRSGAAQCHGYGWRDIVMLKVCAMLYGHEGIRRHIKADGSDKTFICSEWAAAGWKAGGLEGALERYITPGDFAELR